MAKQLKSKRKKKKQNLETMSTKLPEPIALGRECAAIVLAVISIFLGISLYSFLTLSSVNEFGYWQPNANIMGRLGMKAAAVLTYLLGWCSFVVVFWALFLSKYVWSYGYPIFTESNIAQSKLSFILSFLAAACMTIACAVIAAIGFSFEGGGFLGNLIADALILNVNIAGAILVSITVILLSLGLATGIRFSHLVFYSNKLFLLSCAVLGALSCLFLRLFSYGVKKGRTSAKDILSQVSEAFSQKLYGSRSESSTSLIKRPLLKSKSVKRTTDTDFILGETLSDEKINSHKETEEPVISRRLSDNEKKALGLKIRPLSKKQKAEKKEAKNEIDILPNKHMYTDYKHPSTELLVSGEGGLSLGPQDSDLLKNSKRLEQTLSNFRIGGRVIEVHPGPVITLYQFEPAPGVKVNRIINLADDLALSLKVGSVRVYAPVPGKGTVGIEVPNEQREIVRLREVLESPEFQSFASPLALALGKDTYGDPYVTSLAKMPHLLIAGSTGTGKSVCINSILMSLLFRNTPEDLRLILIDPKMLELSVYEDIAHLKSPVITIAKRARGVLWWAVQEMERRYQIMKVLGVRDISMFNRSLPNYRKKQLAGEKKGEKGRVIELEEKDVIATGSPYEGLDRSSGQYSDLPNLVEQNDMQSLPRIVIVVDELADLMLTVGREIEELLTRLAQKARAAGIHLILATQRPSVNVITGLIKANFPARVSFKVASKIDARTVMDFSGAEKLLGQGDMLFYAPGMGTAKRLHSPYVSDNEVHDVVDWIRAQGRPDYDSEIEKMITKLEQTEQGVESSENGDREYDEVYDKAVNLVIEKGQASTSMVQRAFRIGFNRAARILDTMEREGIVGPQDGAKARQVLVGGREEY